MQDIGSPETSVYIYQTTLCHSSQDNNIPLKCVSCTPDDDTEEEMVTSKNKNKTTISTPRLPACLTAFLSHTRSDYVASSYYSARQQLAKLS